MLNKQFNARKQDFQPNAENSVYYCSDYVRTSSLKMQAAFTGVKQNGAISYEYNAADIRENTIKYAGKLQYEVFGEGYDPEDAREIAWLAAQVGLNVFGAGKPTSGSTFGHCVRAVPSTSIDNGFAEAGAIVGWGTDGRSLIDSVEGGTWFVYAGSQMGY